MVLLGEHRFDFRTDRDVEAREPDLRADEVDVQRVGQRVDEAADEEERRELGEEGRRELLLDCSRPAKSPWRESSRRMSSCLENGS